jgi:hypothetical protein
MLIKPMGIGQLVDRSFQLYRKHFVKLMLLMLILFGPIYLLQSLLLSNGEVTRTDSLFQQLQDGSSYEDMLASLESNSNSTGIWQIIVLIVIVVPILLIIIAPVAVSTIVHMVRAFLSGEPIPEVGELLSKAFRRLGPLAGSSVLVGLILFGIYIVTVIAIVLLIVLGAVIVGAANGFGDTSPGIGMILFMVFGGIALLFGMVLLLSYFVIRFCYYLPFVALGEESIGIGRSWTITRKSFWRLFLMYLVLTIILYTIISVTSLLLTFFTGGLTSQLLQSMVSIVLMPLWFIPYVLSFFDLRARNEGNGLEDLIQSTIQENGFQTAEE